MNHIGSSRLHNVQTLTWVIFRFSNCRRVQARQIQGIFQFTKWGKVRWHLVSLNGLHTSGHLLHSIPASPPYRLAPVVSIPLSPSILSHQSAPSIRHYAKIPRVSLLAEFRRLLPAKSDRFPSTPPPRKLQSHPYSYHLIHVLLTYVAPILLCR